MPRLEVWPPVTGKPDDVVGQETDVAGHDVSAKPDAVDLHLLRGSEAEISNGAWVEGPSAGTTRNVKSRQFGQRLHGPEYADPNDHGEHHIHWGRASTHGHGTYAAPLDPPPAPPRPAQTTFSSPEPTTTSVQTPRKLQSEYYAGIVSLAISPAVIVVALLYYLKRRRALRRKRSSSSAGDTESTADSLHPYDVTPGSEPVIATERDPKRLLVVSDKPEQENAPQASPSSLDDPEKLAALRRVLKQAGFTVDAMLAGMGRVARTTSFDSRGEPTNPPPGYER